MKYPAEFVEKVRSAFPENHPIHGVMAEGHGIRRYLEGGAKMKMTPSEIVEAFDDGQQETVYRDAKRATFVKSLLNKFHGL